MTRRPCAPSRSFSARYGSRTSSIGTRRAIRADGVGGTGQQLVGRPLDVAPDDVAAGLVLHGVERGHELVGGVERHLGEPRVALAGEHRVDAALGREHHERALGRVTDERAVLDDRVGAERHRHQVALERHVALAGRAGDLARSVE